MSDQTANTGTANTGNEAAHRTSHTEFYTYFTVIFLVAIPFAILGWVARLVFTQKLPAMNPIFRAWADAGAITPSIFRA
jgi:PufQ cytochrome subunit